MNLDAEILSPAAAAPDAPRADSAVSEAPHALPPIEQVRVGVIGLGYVGLPLAAEFGKLFDTVGFDIDAGRVAELREGHDRTRELDADTLRAARKLRLSTRAEDLRECDVIVVAVPTPVDDYKQPDLAPLRAASATAGRALKPGAVVVFESTVYPGCTEEVCAPILAACSGLELNRGFYLGYSPERINPGDHARRLPSIVKITSGSTPAVAEFVDRLYARIVTAGTHRAESIRVAEAAKVIENTQRDVNIGLVNELAMLFHRLGIDTAQVLAAAGTKWNFLPFRPGLVGGHCVGVDPYYLTYKAQQVGFVPEMILAGRRVNDGMGAYVASRVVKLLVQRRIHAAGARVLVLGLAFKEDCPDLRNTRVVDIITELKDYGALVDVHDPWADAAHARAEHGLEIVDEPRFAQYDAVVLAVAHEDFRRRGAEWVRALLKPEGVVFDVKHVLPADEVEGRL